MSATLNQDYALARWREDAARGDPALYTVSPRHHSLFIWLNAGGNVGWYHPQIEHGKLVGLRGEAFGQPMEGETPEDARILDWVLKLVSPKQQRKIVDAVTAYGT